MPHFHLRGPLPADSRLFVGRKQELNRARKLCLGPLRSYVIVAGARQTGKTSFLYRLRKELGPDSATVLINLQVIPGATPPGLFRFMATEIVKQLRSTDLQSSADATSSGPGLQRLLCQLPEQMGKVTILVDEIAALPPNTATHMANVLRALFSHRLLPGSATLGRFLFLIAGGAELLNLSTTVVSPLVNIATRIDLPDLTLSEVQRMLAYGFSGTPMKVGLLLELADTIYEQTHGHPYLTQRVAACVSDFTARNKSGPDLSWISRAYDDILRSDENIAHVRNALQDPALLDAAFEALQERTSLRQPSSRRERLRLLGIIRDQKGVAVPRNALYAQVIRQRAEEVGITEAEAPSQSTAPQVTVSLLTSIMPAAFCHNLSAKEFPLVRVAIDNSAETGKSAQLYVKASIEGFSDEVVSSLPVPKGEHAQMALLPTLQLGACMALNEIRPATLRVTVRQLGSGSELLLLDQTYPIKLHAYDTALLGIRTPDGNVVDLTDHLCAFVTPHMPEIEALLRKAVEYHPLHRVVGYQGASNVQEARAMAREQVKAIYKALKHDAGLAYVNSPLNFGKLRGQITQRVRLPATSLHENRGRANCIDGTVLYASLLELANLEPVIALAPQHAFIGWRIWRGTDQYDFLETTLIGTDDFEAALDEGYQHYAQARSNEYFERELFDPHGFARLIDVAACRARHIYPLM